MEKPYSYYFDATAVRREYLIGDAFLAKYSSISRDFIWQEQNERFKRLLARAWRMQFYRRLWGQHGVKPGDIRSLLDIEKLPVFDANYLAAAQADPASFGDFIGLDSYAPGLMPPVIAQFFGPRSDEINQQLFARAAMLQGSGADDFAQLLERPQAGRDEISLFEKNCFQNYSIESAGLIASESLERDGLYLMEDAHYVEILNPITRVAVADDVFGELVVTSLYKDDIAPLIRFDTHDLAAICSAKSAVAEANLGLNLRKIQRYQQ